MYDLTKRFAKKLLPKQTLAKHHNRLRSLIGMAYRGNTYSCNLCNTGLRKFITLPTGDLLCPNCGSLPRTRGLWLLINDKLVNNTVLHFSPSPAMKQAVEQNGQTEKYLTTDYEDEFVSEFDFDIEDLKLKDNSIDVIICYHILEHVTNDVQALRELYRVLRTGGNCYIQTPFKEGDCYEDPAIIDPAERLRHFGQEDHVRIYSTKGLMDKMKKAGFNTKLIDRHNELNNLNGLKSRDQTLIGKK